MNIPSKQFDISKMSFGEKLEILVNDKRFNGFVKNGEINWKISICTWSGITMSNLSYVAEKESAINWALHTLKLVK